MGFLLPLGFLALISILLLLLIYFLKPKYHERTVASTYIWKLSLKYRKRKIPFQKLKQSILLFLQVVAICLLAVLLAKPYINQYEDATPEQIILLDASASMRALDNSETRFAKAQSEIREVLNKANENCPITLIYVSDKSSVLCNREIDPVMLKYELDSCEVSNKEANYGDAIILANKVLDKNPNAHVTLYTDHDYENNGYIDVVNVSNMEANVAILDANYKLINNYFNFFITLASYNTASSFNLVLNFYNCVGNNELIKNGKLTVTYPLQLALNEEKEFVIDNLDVYSFEKVTIELMKSQREKIQDSYAYDNEYVLLGGNEKLFTVELFSETGTFINYAIRSLGTCTIDIRNTYENAMFEGYDLYIFDGQIGGATSPKYPQDGSIWIVNPKQNTNYKELNFSTLDDVNAKVTCTSSNNVEYQNICKNLELKQVNLTKHSDLVYDDLYSPIITTSDSYVTMIGGKIDNQQILVLGFDLHYSDLPLSFNMPMLIKNMSEYCLKHIVEEYCYLLGNEVVINPKPKFEKISVKTNDGIYEYDSSKYIACDEGINNITCIYSDGTKENVSVFVSYSKEESNFIKKGSVLSANEYVSASGNVTTSQTAKERVKKEISLYFAIALMALLVIEWGVQYREQY